MGICQLILVDVEPEANIDYSKKEDAKYQEEKGGEVAKLYLDREFQEYNQLKDKGSISNFFEQRLRDNEKSIDDILSILHEIRPQLIKCIHDKKVKEYIEQYEQLHDGKKPNRKKIDDFNNILIAQKISVEEADKTIEECLQEVEKQIRKEQKKKKIKVIGINTIVLVMILNLVGGYIGTYLKEALQINILKNYEFFSFPNLINAVFIGLIIMIQYVVYVVRKDS